MNSVRIEDTIDAFLLGFPALLSIANPIGGAFAFAALTDTYTPPQRESVARQVGCYTLLVALVALWTGSFVLAFFGITLAAVRLAGGLMIVISAWGLLQGSDGPDVGQSRTGERSDGADIALVPLTMPLTAGPGMTSVAVALGSEHPETTDRGRNEVAFFLGLTLATIAVAIAIWLIFRSAERIVRRISPSGLRTLNRLVGFLLLCIGVQILINGVEGVLGPLLAAR